MYTPFSIGQAFKNGIIKFTEIKSVVEITGIYKQSVTKSYKHSYKSSYKEFYYDCIKDLESTDKITILVSEEKRAFLTNDCLCKLRCFADVRVDGESTVKLLLFVEEIINEEVTDLKFTVDPQKKEIAKRKSEMLQNFRHDNVQKDVSLLLTIKIQKRELPKIALIQPLNNKISTDIKRNLGQHNDKYSLEDFKVNIKNEQEIINTLKKIDSQGNFNLIALCRGGGEDEDFNVFDSIAVGEAVIQLRTPFVIAVGHADNEPFAQQLSDRSFNTPADFGTYLSKVCVDSAWNDDLIEREKTLKNDQNDLKTQREEIQERENQLNERERDLQNQSDSYNDEPEELTKAKENLETAKKEITAIKQQNMEMQKQIELAQIKNGKTKNPIAVALIISSIILGAAAFFITAYIFNSQKP